MQAPIRVLIAADTVEEARKLGEIFVPSAGFVVAGSRTRGTIDQTRVADVIVIRSKSPHIQPAGADTPVLWLGAPVGYGREENGISAVLSPDASPAQIRAAAAALAVGLRVEDQGARPHSAESEFSYVEPLTERELEVLNLVAEGFSNPQIARRLGVSRNTVKFHVSSIIAKLGASSRTEAVTIALRRGLIII